MKEACEKIRKRLEEVKKTDVCKGINCCDCDGRYGYKDCDTKQQYLMADKCMEIVSEVEAEFGKDINVLGNTSTEYINKSTEHINKSGDCSTNWIDVKDRLPEKDGYYLTCDHKGNIHVFYQHPMYVTDGKNMAFGISKNHPQYYQPIAWMELPAPFKPTTD